MTATAAPGGLASCDPADLSICDREPIHTPGVIQPDGTLLVARSCDLRVTHASADIAPEAFGRTLYDLLGSATCARFESALAPEDHASARTFCATLSTAGRPDRDLLVHRLGGLFYAELETAGDAAERDALSSRVHEVVHALHRARTCQDLCEVAVGEIKSLTGYDRVVVYRFDPAGHGAVIAEAREDALEPYLGLHYPAGDIPPQARRLYLLKRIRAIADVGYRPLPVLADPRFAGAAPLDMSFCGLRGISPVHIEYLRNMKVGATLAISLVRDDALWGMIVCHHGAPRHASAPMRALCDLIGRIMSLLIGANAQAEMSAERLQRKAALDAIAERIAGGGSVMDALVERSDHVLDLVGAGGALIRLGGQTRLIGRAPPLPDAARVMAGMRAPDAGDPLACDALGLSDPAFAALAETAGGALTLPILHNPDDAITWFRQEVTRTVTWGGDPRKAVEHDPSTGRISPRKSFAAWRTLLTGHSRPWREIDLQVAQDLRRLITTALLRQTERQLAHLSHYDVLTDLPNRRFLQESIARHRNDASAPPASLLFLDLDRFKTVNDSLGHAVGDELLVQVANRLASCVPTRHLVGRLGGDEFVVFCENADAGEVRDVADAIVAAFRLPFLIAGRPYRTTVSVGIASARVVPTGDLLRAADAAMYAAKQNGGDQAVAFESPLHETVSRRLELEQDLFQAAERGEFVLHYQPLVRVGDRGVFGFEALIRWRHPRRGLIGPGEFVPLAEQAKLIVPIGAWALGEALRQVRWWRDRYDRDLLVSVNVSAQQTARPDFPEQVVRAVAEAGVPPCALLLEVTESILMEDAAVRHLEAVRRAGVRIALDDFGTGYSSLAYLRKLPVDEIKVDKLFVEQLGEDARQTAFLGALVHLAHTLDLKVIAEGVEHENQWEHLRALFCDGAQGYWFSRPVPAAEAERILREAEPLPNFSARRVSCPA